MLSLLSQVHKNQETSQTDLLPFLRFAKENSSLRILFLRHLSKTLFLPTDEQQFSRASKNIWLANSRLGCSQGDTQSQPPLTRPSAFISRTDGSHCPKLRSQHPPQLKAGSPSAQLGPAAPQLTGVLLREHLQPIPLVEGAAAVYGAAHGFVELQLPLETRVHPAEEGERRAGVRRRRAGNGGGGGETAGRDRGPTRRRVWRS